MDVFFVLAGCGLFSSRISCGQLRAEAPKHAVFCIAFLKTVLYNKGKNRKGASSMRSKTKTYLQKDTIRALTQKHFPGAKPGKAEELSEGLFNAVYRVYGEGIPGGNAVLKIGPSPEAKVLTYERGIMRTEVEVCRLLKGSGVPVPEILAYDGSHREIPCDYFFMSHLDGVTWAGVKDQITPEKRERLLEQLGGYFARIHRVRSEGRPLGYRTNPAASWGEAFYKMVDGALSDGERMGYSLPCGRIRQVLQKDRPLLDAVTAPTLVGYDIWAGNVLLDPAGLDRITGIIDFERSFFGDRFADFVAASEIFDDVEQEPAFQRGYASVSGEPFTVSPDDRRRMALYRFYMTLLLYIESYRYGEESAVRIREHVGRQVEEMLEQIEAEAG